MNWLLILILAVIVANGIWGYKKGTMRVVFSLVSWILIIVICYIGTPILAEWLVEQTELETVLQDSISNRLNEIVVNSGYAELENALPENLREVLLLENGDIASFIVSSGIVYSIISLISAIALLVIARLAVTLIDIILGLASKLPLVGSMNKLLGAVLGGAKGIIWSWVILAVVELFMITEVDTGVYTMIQESNLLTWLCENNFIVNILLPSL